MKRMLVGLAASALIACEGEPDVNATLYVDPPADGGTCLGVAGFEVKVSQAGKSDQPKKLVGTAPILDPKGCRLFGSFSIQDLDLALPVIVSVQGYDGSGTAARVSGSALIESLRDGPIHLELIVPTDPPPPPLLVFHRSPLLAKAAVSLSDVESMLISTTMQQPNPLLNVNRVGADVYFVPEPGAYGIPTGLAPNVDLNIQFTVQGQMTPKQRITPVWNMNGYYVAD